MKSLIEKVLRKFARSIPIIHNGRLWGYRPNWAEKLLREMDRG